MKNKLKDENIIVHCETEDEFNEYIKLRGLSNRGFKWAMFYGQTCFHWSFSFDQVLYNDLDFILNSYPNRRIVKFKDLIKPEKNKKLVLEFEKIIHAGEMMWSLSMFSGLNADELPSEYYKGNYVSVGNKLIYISAMNENIGIGRRLSSKKKAEIIKQCKAAGSRLAKINKKIRLEEKKKKWCGVERVVI